MAALEYSASNSFWLYLHSELKGVCYNTNVDGIDGHQRVDIRQAISIGIFEIWCQLLSKNLFLDERAVLTIPHEWLAVPNHLRQPTIRDDIYRIAGPA